MIVQTDLTNIKTADPDHPIRQEIAQRWSPRTFDDREVTQEDLNTLFEAARWAPSSFNQQPWRFIYAFRGSEDYDRIFNCLSEFNQKWAGNAPVLLLTAYQKKFDSGKENFHALHDLGLAVGNMLNQAQHMRIALHQMAGVDWEKAQQEFKVPDGFHVATAIAIGYYGGDPSELPGDLEEKELKERSRKPLEKIANEGEWWGQ